ncbi:MAG: hypothetical protein KGJ70_02460, partial [Gemmatimonadota bacterium]|nr:hypothetical protein [Gemmatimonadota bacterium]
MFEHDEALRHLAFFEAIASREEHTAEWRSATAGLVTLRLLDRWLEEGPSAAASGGWAARAVEGAIDQMDEGSPIPSILRSILSAMQDSPVADVHDVLPRLLAYAQALEYDAKL